jgi:serine phosphatase RsbU (regulator of sigma subunit)
MKIRTQLVLVCFLLSVLPLTGIVVYSYTSSRKALEAAYHGEAKRMTAQMDRRLGLIRSDLEQRLAEVSALPTLSDTSQPDERSILMTMGDAASLVDSIEIRPVHPVRPELHIVEGPVPPAAPPPPHAPVAPAPPAVVANDDATDDAEEAAADIADEAVDQAAEKAADALPTLPPRGPVVIDLSRNRLPRFTMTDEQRSQLDRIRMMGQQLGRGWNEMTPEQRNDLQKQLSAVQEAFNKSMQLGQEQYALRVKAAMKARDDARQKQIEERAARRAEKAKAAQPALVPTIVPPAAPVAVAPPAPAVPAAPVNATIAGTASVTTAARRVSPDERKKLAAGERRTSLLFGQRFAAPLRDKGQVVAQIRAHVSSDEVLRRVLGADREDSSEIAFAIDRDGNLYTRTAEDRSTLERIGVRDRVIHKRSLDDIPNWIVVLNADDAGNKGVANEGDAANKDGLRIGVARPVGENFEELRKTAARNFGYGMALVILALIYIVPVANHMTRDVKTVMRGAERIAQGDLMTRLPLASKRSELGQLAATFNKMAEDLSLQQQRIVVQERERQEQAMQQRLLEAEYGRKSEELEEARRFQLSLLPKEVPRHADFELAVFTRTATEVGGDYYDFHIGANGILSAVIGDATGHGARAGTMVTVVKALFAGYDNSESPSRFLRDAADKVKRMDLPRMAMALLVARLERDRVTLSFAGMPPAFVHRAASGKVDEVALNATPLGTLGADYYDASVDLAAGDTMLLMTDGFPELLNEAGLQLGYVGAMQEFAGAATADDAAGVIAALEEAAHRWHGDAPPNDDVTFVVVRARA